jgi:glycerophosphoryl diester phosphodiesterase
MPQPLIIGHRGASAVAPENTIAAFEAAIAAGADGIEFDVRLAGDGVPVVIHDETLYRTAGVRGHVADMSCNELNQFDVPSVAQVFELFKSNELILCLEMKGQELQLAQACCRLIEQHRLQDRVVLSCFGHSALQTVKSIDSTLRTAALFQSPSAFIVEKSIAVGASEITLHHRLVNDRLVQKARLAGLEVVTWTVDDPVWVKRAQETGIHALITNNPSALIAARNAI